ncbi:MAG TPA: hypothetical protein VFH11_00955, partial [Gemmatimonadota bacterium]|nr:hypothetical protein [Gemmatimonadota bacterium]
ACVAGGCRDAAGVTGDGPAWPDTLPAASVIGAPRGLEPVRAVMHVHSLYSHDACDETPFDEAGRPNEACLTRFRRAICTARLGAVFLTEHDRYLVRADAISDALLLREGDRPIIVDGGTRASRIDCGKGSQGALLFAGAENQLMPIAFDSLPRGSDEEQRSFYDADTAGAAAAFRSYGAIVLLPHAEDEPLATIAALNPDGIEIYNPHANFAFKHRLHQGLSRFGAIADILPFYLRTTRAHPDLALLPMFHANRNAIDDWDALLASGRDPFGFGGSDAHENSLPWTMADGERGDSYERMLPWVTNVLLVRDVAGAEVGPTSGHDLDAARAAAIEEAVRDGRFYVVIEAWGTPAGFDFRLEGRAAVAEMGSEVAMAPGQRLVVELPRVGGAAAGIGAGPGSSGAAGRTPQIRARLYRIDAGGSRTIVAESSERIDVAVPGPGAYRVEVGIVPRHLEPWLGGTDYLREVPWIYANPIRVTGPAGAGPAADSATAR